MNQRWDDLREKGRDCRARRVKTGLFGGNWSLWSATSTHVKVEKHGADDDEEKRIESHHFFPQATSVDIAASLSKYSIQIYHTMLASPS